MNFAIDTFPKERLGRISGSRCSPLVPAIDAKKGMVTLAKQLASERYFGVFAETSTWQMEHGTMAEHFAHEHFLKYYDKDIERGSFGYKDELAWSTDAEGRGYGVDYKAPTTLDNFNDYLFDGLSDYEKNQAQFYMMVRGVDRWLVCPYLTETQRMTDNGLTYPIKDDHRMMVIEVSVDKCWQEKFWSNHDFVINERDTFIQMLSLQFPKQ